MATFKLCNDDRLLTILRDTFKASPIKVPEERIKPLVALEVNKQKVKFIGDLNHLLDDPNPIIIKAQTSPMANLSATNSKTVDTELGLKIMGGFLQGFGVEGASLDFAFKGAKKISFSFQNVTREFIDIGELGNILSKRNFNLKNPVNQPFIDETSTCVVIDSVIRSDNFSIHVEEANSSDFKIDTQEIANVLGSGESKVSTKSSSDLNISFQGNVPLAFAFTGFVLLSDEEGSIYYEGEPDKMHLTSVPNNESIKPPLVDLLDSQFGLLELE